MNRSDLKLPCAMLLAMVLIQGIVHLPQWERGIRENDDRHPASRVNNGSGPDYGSRRAGKKSRDSATLSNEEIAPFMATLGEGELNMAGMMSLLLRWSSFDPRAAAAFFLSRRDCAAWREIRCHLLNELAKVDLPAAKSAIAGLEPETREDTARIIVGLLQQRDIQAALVYARELGNDEAEVDVLNEILQSDPLAAAAKLVPGRDAHLPVVAGIAFALLDKDRAEFEAWFQSLRDPDQRSVALAAQRSQTLSATLAEDTGADLRSAALRMAKMLAEDTEASAWIGDLPAESAGKWLEAEGLPAEVAAWAASLPEGPAQDAAVLEVGRRWLEQDKTTASAWVASLPPSGGKDDVVSGHVRQISTTTPARAFEWACTIGEASRRGNVLFEVLWIWSADDPAAARQAVDGMPPGDREKLRSMLDTLRQARDRK